LFRLNEVTKPYRAIPAYYDAENEHLDWLQQDVPFFLKQIGKKKLDVLELAAGTARAAIPIAQAGHRVVATDYDRSMLEIARRKRDFVGLGDAELEIIEADCLKLEMKKQFDAVAIFFNTFLNFTTLEQQDEVLSGVRSHLRPGGRFWLDIFQPNLDLIAKHESKNLDPGVFYVPELDRTVYRSVDVARDPTQQSQLVTFRYKWFDSLGRGRHERRSFTLTFLFPRELRLLLERNGFEILKQWGNYNGSALGPDSPRMITRCRRKT